MAFIYSFIPTQPRPQKIRYSTEMYMELIMSLYISASCHFRFLGRLQSDFNEINIAIFTIRYPFKIEITMKIA